VTPPAATTTTTTSAAALLEAGAVRLTVDGPRADVVLARPDARNAQTPATWRALAAVPTLLPADVRVVVVGGEGPSFSAGLDRRMLDPAGIPGEASLVDMARMDAADLDVTIAEFQRAFAWWRESPAISIAAVQGHAVGAGFQLALACDLMVCADDAQLCMREPALGLVPDLGGTKVLVDRVGYPRALEICATTRWVYAPEAVQLGLALLAVPADALAGTVEDLVAAVTATPAGAVAATKALLRDAGGRTHAEQQAAERAAQATRLAELAQLLG
jgi:enoyl-CoA hydratase/carnithine racemase